jgi:hypothetical protein
MRRPSLFKERDVTRAAKAILAAGLNIDRVEINKEGVIVVIPVKALDSNGDKGMPTPQEISKLI